VPQEIALRSLLRSVTAALAAVTLCVQLDTPLLAQTNTAEIQGVVRDALGGLLPGASVLVVGVASGSRVERASDEAGRFFIPALPVGEYTVTVTLNGFKTITRSHVTVQVGQRIELAITLPLGERTENVDIGIAKDVPLPNGARLQLRWEMFNVLNTANFDVPNRTFGTPNFGRIFSALPARQMQLGVKLQF
jgi:hypothetical protein